MPTVHRPLALTALTARSSHCSQMLVSGSATRRLGRADRGAGDAGSTEVDVMALNHLTLSPRFPVY
jgi:hypothetical protein